MEVFLSYDRDDRAIAHLLSYILASQGITCFTDAQIGPGENFGEAIERMIVRADLVIVLLTKRSAGSQFVNQEIGFARAKGKETWPLQVESTVEIEGLWRMSNGQPLDWANPMDTIGRLIDRLLRSRPGFELDQAESGIQQVLQGKIARTRFIVERFRRLLKTKECVTIRHQSAFSVFAVSNDNDYRSTGAHSDAYVRLLLEERQLLDELVRPGKCSLRLILWPVRAYNGATLRVRFTSLLAWMRENLDNANVDYVCAEYPGPNRYIVPDHFCLDGYKLHQDPGYQMNIVRYGNDQVLHACRDFDDRFRAQPMTKQDAITFVEQRLQALA